MNENYLENGVKIYVAGLILIMILTVCLVFTLKESSENIVVNNTVVVEEK